MPDIQKVSIALTAEQVAVLKTAVDSGEYATTSEIVREALRDWRRKREIQGKDIQRLRQLWAEGKQSGPAVRADLGKLRQEAQKRVKDAASRQIAHAR